MIVLAFLVQAAVAPMLGEIGRQQLPATGCAAYLWSTADHKLVAMAVADPAQLRLAVEGKPAVDLPRVAQHGDGGLGFAASTDYRSAGVTATLDLTVVTSADLKEGASVPQAMLRVDMPNRDTLIVPLGGLIGCHS